MARKKVWIAETVVSDPAVMAFINSSDEWLGGVKRYIPAYTMPAVSFITSRW